MLKRKKPLAKKAEAETQKIQTEFVHNIEDRVQLMVMQGQQAGITSFVLGFPVDDKSVSVHFQNIKMADAFRLAIFTFVRCIKMELEKNPDYPEAQKKLYQDLEKDFLSLITRINEQLLKFKK